MCVCDKDIIRTRSVELNGRNEFLCWEGLVGEGGYRAHVG